MVHLPQLITDLGLIMGAAAVVTLVFKRLKQPTVLGYIIAGLLVGPHFSLFPSVGEAKSIEVWAEIGVIFLLFSLGLEFSFKKLMQVGGSASVTAIVEVAVMLTFGYIAGQAMGWSVMDSIFLGGVLSISSTTIIIRAFEELNLKGKKFVGLVFGILVVEDLVAIVLLVLLSTVAVSRQFDGTDMLFSIVKLVFFLILWFVSGIFFLPSLLRRVRNYMNDEMLLITSIGLCLLMVILATQVGFSPALGAFIMGSILAETTMGGKIEHLTKSVKDVFGAVFFVSVGMLIDPAMLVTYAGPILLIVLITIVGKLLSTSIGALLSGQTLKTSVQAGMSLAQIGEFSFIIATLGLTLNVTSAFLYPIAVAVSAITTFTTPYLIKLSVPLYNWLDRTLPQKWKWGIERYSTGSKTIKGSSDWKLVVSSSLAQTAIYGVILIALVYIYYAYLPQLINPNNDPSITIISTIVLLLLISPFLWALGIRRIKPEASRRLWKDNSFRAGLIIMRVLRMSLAIAFVGFLVHDLPIMHQALIGLSFVVLMVVITYKRLQFIYERLERRFISNFNDKEDTERRESRADLAPWDAHITSYQVPAGFSGLGKTLMELGFRESFGVNIAMIKRGNLTIQVPQREERLYPGDQIYLIGTDEQVDAFRKHIEQNSTTPAAYLNGDEEIVLFDVALDARSLLAGKTIKESGIRETTNGLIVGIERKGARLLNPESTIDLKAHDILWVVGNKKKILTYIKETIG